MGLPFLQWGPKLRPILLSLRLKNRHDFDGFFGVDRRPCGPGSRAISRSRSSRSRRPQPRKCPPDHRAGFSGPGPARRQWHGGCRSVRRDLRAAASDDHGGRGPARGPRPGRAEAAGPGRRLGPGISASCTGRIGALQIGGNWRRARPVRSPGQAAAGLVPALEGECHSRAPWPSSTRVRPSSRAEGAVVIA